MGPVDAAMWSRTDAGAPATAATAAAPGPADAAHGPAAALGLRPQGLLALLAMVSLIALLGGLVLAYRATMDADVMQVSRLLHASAHAAQAMTQAPADERGHRAAEVQRALSQALARTDQVAAREHGLAWVLGGTALAGTVLIGAAVIAFFTRLTADIDRLRRRALAVMAGDRTPQAGLARGDELGQLAAAQDRMVQALASREQALEIERRHQFQQEKMAALGALAAGVLNDIGNPIAAIDGLARAMIDARARGDCHGNNPLCDPALIVRETVRLQFITRQIAELAAPPATEEQLLSLNELVGTTLLLLHFDARLRGVHIDTELDPQLPALQAVGDQLVQLLMNLVVSAAESLQGQPGAKGMIIVKTGRDHGCARLTVADNVRGMDNAPPSPAVNPWAVPRHGRSLNLPVCRSIVAGLGGSIDIAAHATGGTEVVVRLPLPSGPVP